MSWLLTITILDMILLLGQEQHVFIRELGLWWNASFLLCSFSSLKWQECLFSIRKSQLWRSNLKEALLSAVNAVSSPAASPVSSVVQDW